MELSVHKFSASNLLHQPSVLEGIVHDLLKRLIVSFETTTKLDYLARHAHSPNHSFFFGNRYYFKKELNGDMKDTVLCQPFL